MLLENIPQHLPGGGKLNDQFLPRGRHIDHRTGTAELLVASPTIVAVDIMLVLARTQGSLLGGEQVVGGAHRAGAAVEWRVIVGVRTVRSMRRVSGVRGVVRHVGAAIMAFFFLLVRAITLSATRLQLQQNK